MAKFLSKIFHSITFQTFEGTQTKSKNWAENNNEKLSAIYSNDSEYINDLKRNENDVDWASEWVNEWKTEREREREWSVDIHMNKIING